MNEIKYILRRFIPYCTLLCVLLSSGCKKDDLEPTLEDEDRVVTISLGITTSSQYGGSRSISRSSINSDSVDPNSLGKAESVINRIRVFAFDGNKFDNMIYHDTKNAAIDMQVIEIVVNKTANKNFFVIVNEPSSLSTELALIKDIGAFQHMKYRLSEYTVAGYAHDFKFKGTDFELPMTGELLNYSIVANDFIIPVVSAVRSVARVDVYLQRESADIPPVTLLTTSTLDIRNTRDDGYVFNNASIDGGTIGLLPSTITNMSSKTVPYKGQPSETPDQLEEPPLRAFSFYTPERTCVNDSEKISFTLRDIGYGDSKFPITFENVIINNGRIGDGGITTLNKIERNRVYKVYCTVNSQGSILSNIIIENWTDVEVDGNIDDNDDMITAPSKVLMNSENFPNGGFTSKVIKYKGGKTVKIFLPTNEAGTEWGEAVTSDDDFNTKFAASSEQDWLGATLTMGTTDASGSFTFTYKASGNILGSYKSYIIKLQSGAVVRHMSIVYDGDRLYAVGDVYPYGATKENNDIEGVVWQVNKLDGTPNMNKDATGISGSIVALHDEIGQDGETTMAWETTEEGFATKDLKMSKNLTSYYSNGKAGCDYITNYLNSNITKANGYEETVEKTWAHTAANFPAYNACVKIKNGGTQGWYLPAWSQLDNVRKGLVADGSKLALVLYPPDGNNPNLLTGATSLSGKYWSSSEKNDKNSHFMHFSIIGTNSVEIKSNTLNVRCVRDF